MRANIVFVDTGAFIALAVEADANHERAVECISALGSACKFVTSELVVAETAAFLQNRVSISVSRKFWRSVFQDRSDIRIVWSMPVDFARAWKIAEAYVDQSFSLVDCVSFAMIERLRIKKAIAFDKHFLIFRPTNHQLQRVS